jgi:hypothetical protein
VEFPAKADLGEFLSNFDGWGVSVIFFVFRQMTAAFWKIR